jgi:hypothetical protein
METSIPLLFGTDPDPKLLLNAELVYKLSMVGTQIQPFQNHK